MTSNPTTGSNGHMARIGTDNGDSNNEKTAIALSDIDEMTPAGRTMNECLKSLKVVEIHSDKSKLAALDYGHKSTDQEQAK